MIKLFLFALMLGQFIHQAPKVEIWAEPVPYLESAVMEDYLAPVSSYGSGHRGIDFRVQPGGPIHSPADGLVHFSGLVVDRNVISIRTNTGKIASFEPVCSKLTRGESVSRGEIIGHHCVASEAYEYHCENCVHASARDEYGYLSPMHMFGQLSPSELLS